MQYPRFLLPLLFSLLWVLPGNAADWLTAPSYYSHEPQSGVRVTQYAPVAPAYVYSPPNYTRSGYRHLRSTIQAGGSADNYHLVEEWGNPVAPYEQWRFPFRPYGSPYDAWGPPLAGANPGYGFGYGGFGVGGGNFTPGPNYPYYHPQSPAPWVDGHYPTYDRNDRTPYYEPYQP
jgi:hypothetical protein